MRSFAQLVRTCAVCAKADAARVVCSLQGIGIAHIAQLKLDCFMQVIAQAAGLSR